MTAPVVDCSAAAAWILADEHSGPADAALDAVVAHGAVAPASLATLDRKLARSAAAAGVETIGP